VSGSVRLQELGNVRNQWIVRVWVGQKGTDAQQDFGNGQSRTPLVLEDIKTNSSVRVDVAVVDTGGEMNLRRLEWVISWKMDIKEEDTAGIR